MTTTTLDTLKMTRRIRDALYEDVKDMSLPERLAFYRAKAQAFHRQVGIDVPTRSLELPDAERTPSMIDNGHAQHES
jgi:hypothetical protein